MKKNNKKKRTAIVLAALLLCGAMTPVYPVEETYKVVAASRLSDVTVSNAGGIYVGQVTVELSHENPNAKIYYTLDDTTPTNGSTLYTGPITISSSCTLRTIASAEGYYDSNVNVQNYNIVSNFEFSSQILTIAEFQKKDMKELLSSETKDYFDITWSSSNPDMASIDEDGILTANKAGGTVITATTHNGISTQCMVTVTEADMKVSASKTINVGNGAAIEVSVNGENSNIRYESSNPAIASVTENGYVTAKKPGTCTIKVICGNTVKTCKITVPAVKLKISASSVKIPYGKGKQLTASGNIASSWIKWKSSNPKVASVSSSGYVIANGKGKCVISAYYGNAKVKCTVTVPNYKLTVPKKITLYAGEQREITKGISINGIRVNKASVKVKNKKIVDVVNGNLIGKHPGVTQITISAKGKRMTCKVTVPKTKMKFSCKTTTTVKNQTAKSISWRVLSKKANVTLVKAVSSKPANVEIANIGKRNIIVHAKKYNTSSTISLKFSDGSVKRIKVKVPKQTVLEKIAKQNVYTYTGSRYTDGPINYSSIYLYNNTGKTIDCVDYTVYEYDATGKRLSGECKYRYTETIYAGTRTLESPFYCWYDTRKLRSCIQKVYYSDGTTWTNPYYKEWTKKYSKKYGKE